MTVGKVDAVTFPPKGAGLADVPTDPIRVFRACPNWCQVDHRTEIEVEAEADSGVRHHRQPITGPAIPITGGGMAVTVLQVQALATGDCGPVEIQVDTPDILSPMAAHVLSLDLAEAVRVANA